MNYYNEFDPYAAAWLRSLIAEGVIADGEVDERSIVEVQASDLAGFRQCHFFAGIGGWSYALRLAGIPDDEPIWTGSCPCQPFSSAGKQKGTADARHLWPEMFRLIRECRPATIFGEQVEAAVRLGWVDGVCGDVEGEGYAFGFHILGAHSIGAPHIRQRIYWVAHNESERRRGRSPSAEESAGWGGDENGSLASELANATGPRHAGAGPRSGSDRSGSDQMSQREGSLNESAGSGTIDDGMEHAESNGREQGRAESIGRGVASRCGIGGLDNADGIGRGAWRRDYSLDDGVESVAVVESCGMADAASPSGLEQQREPGRGSRGSEAADNPAECAGFGGTDGERVGDASSERQHSVGSISGKHGAESTRDVERLRSHWGDARSILCRDGKQRRIPTQPGLFPLVDGLSGRVVVVRPGSETGTAIQEGDTRQVSRVGTLKGAGNAIVPQVAAVFVRAFYETINGDHEA